MKNSRSLTDGNGYELLDLLHDRVSRLLARVDLELLAFEVIGAAVVLEIIFSLNAVW